MEITDVNLYFVDLGNLANKEHLVQEVFHMVDIDGSGTIDLDELFGLFKITLLKGGSDEKGMIFYRKLTNVKFYCWFLTPRLQPFLIILLRSAKSFQ